jgi:PAS domain S-box-containing protein
MWGWLRKSHDGNRSAKGRSAIPTGHVPRLIGRCLEILQGNSTGFGGLLLVAVGYAAVLQGLLRLSPSLSLSTTGLLLFAAGFAVVTVHLWLSSKLLKDQEEKLQELQTALSQERSRHRETQKAFHHLQLRWKTLLETIPDIVVEVDHNFVFTTANPAAKRFYGNDLLGREAGEYLYYPQPLYDHSQVLLSGSECTLYLEDWLRRQDGTGRLIAWHGRAIKDEDGSVLGILGVGRDITDLRSLENSHRSQQELVSAITSAAQDAVIMIDHCGRITFWNQAATKIFGYTAHEVLGKDAHRLLCPPELLPAYERNFPHFARTGKGRAVGQTLRLEAVRKDNTRIPIELSLGSFRSKGCWFAVAVIRDITTLVQQEKERRLAEQRYQALAEHIEDLIWLVGKDLKIQYVNPAVERLLGFSREELVGKSLGELLVPSSFELVKEWSQGQLSAEKVSEGHGLLLEVRYPTREEKLVDAQLKCTVIPDETGSPWLILGVSRPVLAAGLWDGFSVGNSVVAEFLAHLMALAAEGSPVHKFLEVLDHFLKSTRLLPEESRLVLCRRCRRSRKKQAISDGAMDELPGNPLPSSNGMASATSWNGEEFRETIAKDGSHRACQEGETTDRKVSEGPMPPTLRRHNSEPLIGEVPQGDCIFRVNAEECTLTGAGPTKKGFSLPIPGEGGRFLGILHIDCEGLSPAAETLLARWVLPILRLVLLGEQRAQARQELETVLGRKIRRLRGFHALVRLGYHWQEDPESCTPQNFLRQCAGILQASLSPDGWTGVRILWNGQEVATEDFCDGPWKLASSFWADGELAGAVEVSSPVPLEFFQTALLSEDRAYLDQWATMLGLLLSRASVPAGY